MSLRRSSPIGIEWPAAPGAVNYRVVLRDLTVDEYVFKRETLVPELEIRRGELHRGHHYEWRPQFQREHFGEWEDHLPYIRLIDPNAKPGGEVTELEWEDTGSPAYRVLVKDETLDAYVIEDGLFGNRYLLDWSLLNPAHVLRYSVDAAQGGTEWKELHSSEPLEPPAGLREKARREQSKAVEAVAAVEDGPAIQVSEPEEETEEKAVSPHPGKREVIFLWTCDTEVNMRYMNPPEPSQGVDHQIFCTQGRRSYGIEFMMDLLEQHGFLGTFFVDILLEHQFGRPALERVVAAILERGHDIQLHLHPSPNLLLSPERDRLGRLAPALTAGDAELFREALRLSIDLFEQRVGRTPVAYRAGAYHLCDAYLEVLAEEGLLVDSSLYPFKNCRVSRWMATRTQPFWVGDLLEIPVSWLAYSNSDGWTAQQLAPAQGGVQQDAVAKFDASGEGPPLTFVYLAHSFSLLEYVLEQGTNPAAGWNDHYKLHCPEDAYGAVRMAEDAEMRVFGGVERSRIATMTRLLHGLSQRPEVRGITFEKLVEEGLDRWPRGRTSPVDPLPAHDGMAGQVIQTGTRVYSTDYLAEFERHPEGVS